MQVLLHLLGLKENKGKCWNCFRVPMCSGWTLFPLYWQITEAKKCKEKQGRPKDVQALHSTECILSKDDDEDRAGGGTAVQTLSFQT